MNDGRNSKRGTDGVFRPLNDVSFANSAEVEFEPRLRIAESTSETTSCRFCRASHRAAIHRTF